MIEIRPLDDANADTVAVPVTQPPGQAPERFAAQIGALGDELRGARGDAVVLHDPRVVLAGLGERGEVDADAFRTAGAAVAGALERVGGSVCWLLDESVDVPLPVQAGALVEGMILGGYSPGKWKTDDDAPRTIDCIVIGHAETPELRDAAQRAELLAEHANRARDMVNTPANELHPHAVGERAKELAAEHEHLSVTVLADSELDKLGMGALTAVGRGSRRGPRLVVVRYEPPAPTHPDVVIAFVGKTLTFDAGGISLKPSNNMQNMKGDMAGGAAALHGIGAVAALGLPVRVMAVLPAAENLPDGDAYLPSDILRAANGKTIEITDTDAEGRLVLADALWYARREGATHVIDLATLTGAMMTALGDQYAGYFANDEDWSRRIDEAGQRSGDYMWRFPLHRSYRRFIVSDYADLKNSAAHQMGGAIYAAKFLQEFAGEGPWAHVDLALTPFTGWIEARDDYYRVKGGTGFGVRLLAELATGFA